MTKKNGQYPFPVKFAEFVESKGIRQRHVEAISEAMQSIDSGAGSGAVFWRRVVQGAMDAGWVLEPKLTPDELLDSSPAFLKWLGMKVNKIYVEATDIPPA